MKENEISVSEKEKQANSLALCTKFLDVFTAQGGKLQEHEKTMFLEIASAYNLNPFKREIYVVAYTTKGKNGEQDKRQLSIITGYEVYLKRAYKSGLLNGWEVTTEGSGDAMTATIKIHRDDWDNPFVHTVAFKEYAQYTWTLNKASNKYEKKLNTFWENKPATMLKKVAMGQGFRLCFPDELGGMPYLEEEIQQTPIPEDVIEVTSEQIEMPQRESEKNVACVAELTEEEKAKILEDEKKELEVNSGHNTK